MIALKSIPEHSPIELNLLAEYEAFFFSFIAVMLIFVFIKVKFFNSVNKNIPLTDDLTEFQFDNRDILMQPKKIVDESIIPFANYSLNWFYMVFGILFIIAIYHLYP